MCMTVVMPFDRMMGMSVSGFILTVDMGMDMAVLVGVDQIAVGVFVAVRMAMFMGVLQGNGFFYYQHCCTNHNRQSQEKLKAWPFPQKKHPKEHPEKRCNRIIGTGFCRTQYQQGAGMEPKAPHSLKAQGDACGSYQDNGSNQSFGKFFPE